jgi:hypothetical protein
VAKNEEVAAMVLMWVVTHTRIDPGHPDVEGEISPRKWGIVEGTGIAVLQKGIV